MASDSTETITGPLGAAIDKIAQQTEGIVIDGIEIMYTKALQAATQMKTEFDKAHLGISSSVENAQSQVNQTKNDIVAQKTQFVSSMSNITDSHQKAAMNILSSVSQTKNSIGTTTADTGKTLHGMSNDIHSTISSATNSLASASYGIKDGFEKSATNMINKSTDHVKDMQSEANNHITQLKNDLSTKKDEYERSSQLTLHKMSEIARNHVSNIEGQSGEFARRANLYRNSVLDEIYQKGQGVSNGIRTGHNEIKNTIAKTQTTTESLIRTTLRTIAVLAVSLIVFAFIAYLLFRPSINRSPKISKK